jgi:hypothetical protein
VVVDGFTLDKITQELKNLKLAPVMWMDGEDTSCHFIKRKKIKQEWRKK